MVRPPPLAAAAALAIVLAACGDGAPRGAPDEPAPPPAPATAPPPAAASPELAALPGALWYVVEDEPPVLVRLAAGVRTERARGVTPSGAWLPDGRLLGIRAAGGAEQLVAVGAEGPPHALGPAGSRIGTPAVDPRGRWIIAPIAIAGATELRRIDLATGGVVELSGGRDATAVAALAGGAVAFAAGGELYRATADLAGARALGRDPHADTAPVASPDGATLAFLSDRDGPLRIYLVRADGTAAPHRLTERTEPARDESHVAWSPDGTRIAYVVARGPRRHVWVRDLATGREHDLTPEGVFDDEPCFSPDGRWVAVSRTRGHDVDLWAIPVDLGEPVRITTERFRDRAPQWR